MRAVVSKNLRGYLWSCRGIEESGDDRYICSISAKAMIVAFEAVLAVTLGLSVVILAGYF